MRDFTECSFLHILIASKSRIIKRKRYVAYGEDKSNLVTIFLGLPATIWKK
jgi:hypothetical protein